MPARIFKKEFWARKCRCLLSCLSRFCCVPCKKGKAGRNRGSRCRGIPEGDFAEVHRTEGEAPTVQWYDVTPSPETQLEFRDAPERAAVKAEVPPQPTERPVVGPVHPEPLETPTKKCDVWRSLQKWQATIHLLVQEQITARPIQYLCCLVLSGLLQMAFALPRVAVKITRNSIVFLLKHTPLCGVMKKLVRFIFI